MLPSGRTNPNRGLSSTQLVSNGAVGSSTNCVMTWAAQRLMPRNLHVRRSGKGDECGVRQGIGDDLTAECGGRHIQIAGQEQCGHIRCHVDIGGVRQFRYIDDRAELCIKLSRTLAVKGSIGANSVQNDLICGGDGIVRADHGQMHQQGQRRSWRHRGRQ